MEKHVSTQSGAAAANGEGRPRVPSVDEAMKMPQTVTPESEPITDLIDGVRIRHAITHPDQRGSVCEVYNPAWGFTEEPLVYVYQVTIRPGQVKGWVLHQTYSDRIFFSVGMVKVGLYDDREGSATRGKVNELYFGTDHRALLRIPPGVWHAMKNVGVEDALFFNCPTRAYNHEDPDKWALPADSEEIPLRI